MHGRWNGGPVRVESRRWHEPRYYAVRRLAVVVERSARGANDVSPGGGQTGGQPGAEVRGRSDVAQADARTAGSSDPRSASRSTRATTCTCVHMTDTLHAAHGDRSGDRIRRPASAARRRPTCSNTTRPETSSTIGAARAPATTGPRTTPGSPWTTAATSGSAARAARIRAFSSSRATASSSRSSARRPPSRGRARERCGRGPDTAYAGVSPGRGAAGRGAAGGRGGRGGRGGGPPPLPANSTSMDSFGGPVGFSFDTKANEAFVADGARNHRVAVIDMTTGAIKRFWGAYGTKPNDADIGEVRPGGAGAEAVRQPGAAAPSSRTTGSSTCATRRTIASRSSRRTDRS